MVSAGIYWSGKTRIHCLEGGKVDADRYVNHLEESLVPDIRLLYPDGDYTLQQDGATPHTSHVTSDYLVANEIPYILKDNWAPHLNPMDYAIWNQLSTKVYENRRTPFTVNQLKTRITEFWEDLSIESSHQSGLGRKGYAM